MTLVGSSVAKPVTVVVGVLLLLLVGVVAFQRIAIQLTPNVEDTIIAVTTRWEGASPLEIEQEVVDKQEEQLQGIANLRALTSKSQQGQGVVRLEFTVGTPKEVALREVSDKLREVPDYPDGVDEPVVEASDPDNRDYIAWVLLRTDDPDFDIRTLQDFAEDRLKPRLERIPGMAEVNVLGGRERETQVVYDPELLAAKGITPADLARALRQQNRDVSAGALEQAKSNVRVRLTGQFESVADVEDTVVAQTSGGPVFVRDVARVEETYKEPFTFVRSMGRQVLAINFQREVGANVISVMDALKAEIVNLNEPGGLLETHARKVGIEGRLWLAQAFDQTVYIDDALALVRDNIWVGGTLAVLVLLVFLRAVRPTLIVALAIPISTVGAVVTMVALGRSINVISLAGMAFAVGMVVDNAIVVLENIYRHLEMGKSPLRAAIDGGNEVFGAVLASTLTTVVVFVPVLLIQEEAGQLFRDISLAIVAAVGLSLLVSMTVVPAAASRFLKAKRTAADAAPAAARPATGAARGSFLTRAIARLVHAQNGSVVARIAVVAVFTVLSVTGTLLLVPPTDYLPTGNRNLVFGLLIPPPNYSLSQQTELAQRIEASVRPHWEAGQAPEGSPERADALARRPRVDAVDRATGRVRQGLQGPPLDNYFLVSFDGIMFHGAISSDPTKVVDVLPLFAHATRPEVAPGVYAFAFQVPLFRLGGNSGSAIKIDFTGDDLDAVANATTAVFMQLMRQFGPGTTQPDPSNFSVPTSELRFLPERSRLAESGLSFDDVALAIQSLGDGALVGEYRMGGDTVDLKLISAGAFAGDALDRVGAAPLATSNGATVPVESLARPVFVNAPQQINRVGRQRSITLQFTPPPGMPLGAAIDEVAAVLDDARTRGVIPPDVATTFTGSASKLDAVQRALLGDGTLVGTLGSSLVLALLVVYLMMCVLYQSFALPLVIMFTVPLATLGGFAALAGVHAWSLADPYLPVQNLDVLTMLGFVILIGIVVNNAILIVHQALNFMRPESEQEDGGSGLGQLGIRDAITESVRSRVRPILMSTLTSVLGMAPLVLMPGSGSELYRGLGSVVVGGLIVSTLFTLVLVPALLSLYLEFAAALARRFKGAAPAATPAVATLLVALLTLGLGSCAGTNDEAVTRYDDLAERIARETLDEARGGAPVVTHFAPSGVEELLAPRAEELEALGGAATWSALSPARASDLAGTEQVVRRMELAEARALALAHNLGLSARRLEPDAAREGAIAADAAFDTVLFADAEYERVDEPRPVPLLGGVQLGTPLSVSDRVRVQSGVRQLLSSGATVSASAFAERFDNRTPGIDFLPDPAWRAGVALELSQPLLRGFGSERTEAERVLAERAVRRSEADLAADALALDALVEQAYWSLAEAEARLLVQQNLLGSAEEVARVLAERRDFDTSAAQYADALATVEQRRTDLVRARLLVERASDTLVGLLDAEDLSLAGDVQLSAAEGFALEPVAVDLRGSIADALAHRPELRAALLDVEDASLRARLAQNLSQPRLDLVARLDAIGEDESFGEGVTSLTEDDFLSGLVGLSFELPIGDRAADAEERRTRVAGRIAVLRYEELVRSVVLEVKDALRELRTSYELIGATRSQRIAQTENLRALLAEKEQRAAQTPEFLGLEFDRQERLARAQLDELQAVANYNRALAAYRRAIGRPRP
jgi:HAE1 family hydrophobic/amphiphilic exporter-1